MLKDKQTKSKNIILIGGYGSGKTTTAIEMMGNRPYQIYPANDIAIDGREVDTKEVRTCCCKLKDITLNNSVRRVVDCDRSNFRLVRSSHSREDVVC